MKKIIFALIVSAMVAGCNTNDETLNSAQNEPEDGPIITVGVPAIMQKVNPKEFELIIGPAYYFGIMEKVNAEELELIVGPAHFVGKMDEVKNVDLP